MFGDMKKRCVQFVVKSAIGRFIKEVSKQHLSDPKVTRSGLQFELKNLEVDEEAVNREIIDSSMEEGEVAPIRLAAGFISYITGEILWTLTQPRNVKVEGIDLTFDYIHVEKPKTAGQKPGESRSPSKPQSARDVSGSTLYSSMLAGDLTEEILQKEVLQGQRRSGQSAADHEELDDPEEEGEPTISDGVNVLSQVIKSLVHNTTGEMLEITVRLRVPPVGTMIEVGKPLPIGTHQLLVHVPKIRIVDETDAKWSLGNSFKKRIHTTGGLIQVIPWSMEEAMANVTLVNGVSPSPTGIQPGEEDREQTDTHRLDMKNTVFSGRDIQSEKNEIVIQFYDVKEDPSAPLPAGVGTRWRVELTFGEVHGLLTPPQLTTLISLFRNLTAPPEALSLAQPETTETDRASTAETAAPSAPRPAPGNAPRATLPTIIKLDCESINLAVLHSDTPQVVTRCWRQLHSGLDLYDTLVTQHYSVTLERLVAVSSTPVEQRYLDPNDPLFPVFKEHGGNYFTFALRSLTVHEKQPNRPRTVVLRLFKPPEPAATASTGAQGSGNEAKGSGAGGKRARYQLSASILTSCPMTPDFAATYGVIAPHRHRNVVRQSATFDAECHIEFFLDVLVLNRFFQLQDSISALLEAEATATQSAIRRQERLFLKSQRAGPARIGSFQSDFDELEGLQPIPDEDVERIASGATQQRFTDPYQSIPQAPPPAATHATQPTAPPKVDPFDTVFSLKASCGALSVEVTFPCSRTPNPDLYGPFTQKLFKGLAAASGGAIPDPSGLPTLLTPEQRAKLESISLSRSLFFDAQSVVLQLPELTVSQLQVDCRKLVFGFRNLVDGKRTILAEVDLQPLPRYAIDARRGIQTERHPVDEVEDDLFVPLPALMIQLRETQVGPKPTPKLRSGKPFPFSTADPDAKTEQTESNFEAEADVAIRLHITDIKARMQQDEFLLLLFMVDEVTECLVGAISQRNASLEAKRTAKLQQLQQELEMDDDGFADARSEEPGEGGRTAREMLFFSATSELEQELNSAQRKPDPDSTVAVYIRVHGATLNIRAPRLSEAQQPIADPLWMLRPPAEQDVSKLDYLCHKYVAEASGVEMFIYNQTVGTTTDIVFNLRADHLAMFEKLPTLPPNVPDLNPPISVQENSPMWGQKVPLLQGYTQLHNRAENRSSPLRKVARISLHRITDLAARTQDLRLDLLFDRVAVTHQPAREGDHWLFALMQFVSDLPVMNVNDDESLPDSEANVSPYHCVTSVDLRCIDTLASYRPFGMTSTVVALCPSFTVNTGKLIGGDPKAIITMQFTSLELYLNHDWLADLVSYDYTQGMNSVFGSTASGLASDLQRLGFVEIGRISSIERCVAPTVTIRMNQIMQKPIVVEVGGLFLDITVASDSFDLMIKLLSHFGGGGDWEYLPTPFALIEATAGKQYWICSPRPPPPLGPQVKILVPDYPALIAERLTMSYDAEDPPGEPPGPSMSHMGSGSPLPSQFFQASALTFGVDAHSGKRRRPGPKVSGLISGSTHQIKYSHDQETDFIDLELVDEGPTKPQVKWRIPAHADEPGEETGHQPQRVGLTSLFTSTDHFSVRNRVEPSVLSEATAKPLQGMPPIAVEIVLVNTNVVAKFYGGKDFGTTIEARPDQVNTHAIFYRNHYAEHTGSDGRTRLQSTRVKSEEVRGEFTGLKLQVDVFEEGHPQSMHLLCSMRDFEVTDNVEQSPVRTLLSCTVPAAFRDTDCDLFEMKWITHLPKLRGHSSGQDSLKPMPEEDISIRVQPLWISLHERTLNLLKGFFVPADPLAPEDLFTTADYVDEESGMTLIGRVAPREGRPGQEVEAEAQDPMGVDSDPSRSPPVSISTMFFNRVLIHPVDISFSWFPENSLSATGLWQKDYTEFLHVTSVEGARMRLSGVVIHRSTLEDLPVNLLAAIYPQLTPNILLLLCGLSPVRSVSEVAGAIKDVVLKPWESLKKNKGLYSGIVRGLASCGRRLTGEAFRLGSSTSLMGHRVIHGTAAPVQPEAHRQPMLRGDQPMGVSDGLHRGAQAIATGVSGVPEGVRVCIGEDGHLSELPLVLLVPVDGVMRGLTEVFLGFRNYFRPDSRQHEVRQFKPGAHPR